MDFCRSHVLVCAGTGCTSSDSLKIMEKLEDQLQEYGLEKEVKVIKTGCFGLCEAGPIVIVYPERAFYSQVKLRDIERITEEHLLKGRVVKELLYKESIEGDTIKSIDEISFYKKQKRIVLKNCGLINPELIEEYIAFDGYQALAKVLTEMTPEEVIDVVKKSELRGRGGGGFPTGLKWELTAKEEAEEKYVVCNADEGDPGAFMDRSLLEGDPHVIIEAMAIAAYAVGAKEGYVYIRAEYPIAVKRLRIAIDQAKEMGLLGENIFGTDFSFDLQVRLGAGAFVCGEETALIHSIEGKRGMPRPRPPFPSHKGIWDQPTLINNVEAYANIPQIILKGAEWFCSIGTKESKGTKVFALGGKINNTGLLEITMGTTLREVIYEIGGGISNGKAFKAVQTGGPSGGCIPAEHIDTPIDYDNLLKLGSMMGSGGMVVMDEDNCMVDIARFFLEFTVEESCGKCTPCREGTKRMLDLLEKISQGKGTMKDVEKLETLAKTVKDASLCGLGQTAPNPVLSTLKYFRSEYEAHVKEKQCPAGVCEELLKYSVLENLCKKCGICAKKCPVGCISGIKAKEAYVIHAENCTKCGACVLVCPFKAITKN
ncbi:NAD(P)-dependent iron-only hydrogenase diaphorase component flavoprotein [Clostridium aceticum]|uniref:NAD(P)-dependent iron-only hydrogenase diaphorase component flavoprotein n=1 Tax=Clostridium aceticum TaxID=84022 RepID=A0A0D8IB50_9CLOT|nr:NADH-quinone oxidoreductase subunit NuoF [Clostridium aceticum]AKL96717.1 NAD(P)-dependent iron-only hydrogenase diaphorase component flavoprotein [Clostridium aceticum]KJF27488.1 NADH dehydrogenase [Clostridium aceticum]